MSSSTDAQISVRLDPKLVEAVRERLPFDERTGKPQHGAMKHLVGTLLENWVQKNAKKKPDC